VEVPEGRPHVPIDFDKLAVGEKAPLISPRDIFAALPGRAAGFGYLRDVQGQVLDAWTKRRTERDLLIKMNTGTGKTAVGALILQSSLNENRGPALYVSPDNYLAQQVRQQVRAGLGIETVDDPECSAYLAGEAIAVVNIHKLINGKSVFGGPASTRARPLKIGTVVIDDAHAALATTDAQCTVRIPEDQAAYDRLLEVFHSDLEQQSNSGLLGVETGEPGAVVRVPFWAWATRTTEVSRILYDCRNDDDLMFTLPFVMDMLPICQAVFTAEAVEIKPPLPPVGLIQSLADAKRRVYLTATLADDSVLVTHFNAASSAAERPITPVSAADLGDRMILAPQELNPGQQEEDIRHAMRGLADQVNVVVLVPSRRRAREWEDLADVVTAADGIEAAVARLQSEDHVGLVVLINKYDGIDLPGDACRVLVIDGLPEAYGGIDRREAVVLGESDAMVSRQLQRIEQGMGRGVRSAEDYCAVILLGPKLTQLIADPANLARFGPATRTQLELSRRLAQQLDNATLADIVAVVRQCLDRDPGWVTASRHALAGVTYGPARLDPVAVHLRAAFNAAATGQYRPAAAEISAAINETKDDRVKGWLQEQLAGYTQLTDPAQAQQILAGALRLNPRLMRPLEGVSYSRLSPAADQGRAAAEYLAARYASRNDLIVGVQAVLDDLVFDPEHTDEFEDATEQLAAHLGFTAQRPERDTNNGPDVLWSVGSLSYLVIECKSGVTTDQIRRSDAEQLAHSMSWFAEHYDQTCRPAPVMIHPANILAADATTPPGARIVTADRLERLRTAVRGAVVALGDAGTWGDPDAVCAQLTHNKLTGTAIVSAYTVAPRRPPPTPAGGHLPGVMSGRTGRRSGR
jgi:hypothetical protein